MYPEMVRSTITIEFQKEGYWHCYEMTYSHIFASTHGDHTVKIVDFSTGKILRVGFAPSAMIGIDTHRASPNSLGCSFSPQESGSPCERLFGFCRHGVELEEERNAGVYADHAECHDFLPGLAPHVCIPAVYHSQRRDRPHHLWHGRVSLELHRTAFFMC